MAHAPAYAAPVRSGSFVIGDLYPEAKGPEPSTSQLSNPHEVAAAANGNGGAGVVLTGPPLDPRAFFNQPAAWAVLLILALLFLGMRKG
jgi:hypothetical protein